jgi:hypothetical protein
MVLKRSIEQWRGCDPEAMAYHLSEAAIMYAFRDAKADILALNAENERLRMSISDSMIDYVEKSHGIRRDHKGRWWVELTINTTLGGKKSLRETIYAAMKERPNE